MSWKRGKYLGLPPTSRFGHTTTAIGPHLLIFGGWEYTKAQNEIIVLREVNNQDGQEGQEMEEGQEGEEQYEEGQEEQYGDEDIDQ